MSNVWNSDEDQLIKTVPLSAKVFPVKIRPAKLQSMFSCSHLFAVCISFITISLLATLPTFIIILLNQFPHPCPFFSVLPFLPNILRNGSVEEECSAPRAPSP